MGTLCKRENSQTIRRIEEGFAMTTLNDDQKRTITARFIGMLLEYEKRSQRYSCAFNSLRIIITVGSLIVPALLSVQYTAGNVSSASANISANVYWCVWMLSLLVTISNGITTLMKVDKKYFVLNTTYQLLMSVGWHYIHLSGKFNTTQPLLPPSTHQNQFVIFCNTIEKIRMKQIEDEYYKSGEQHAPVAVDMLQQTPAKLPFSPYDEKSSPIVNGPPFTTVSRLRAGPIQSNTATAGAASPAGTGTGASGRFQDNQEGTSFPPLSPIPEDSEA